MQNAAYKGNHIMWTMGDDFTYQNANTWYKSMDMLIPAVNARVSKLVLYVVTILYWSLVECCLSGRSYYVDRRHGLQLSKCSNMV